MPPKSGVMAFVHAKNGEEGTRPNVPQDGRRFDDLKMQVNQPPRSNSAAPRQSGQDGGQRHPHHPKKGQLATQSRDASRTRGVIYDTDASDADKTSTAHSERRVPEPQRAAQKRREGRQDDYSDDSGDGSDESEDLPPDPLTRTGGRLIDGNVDDRQMRIMQRMHMKGDTYPSTTSGPPSHLEPVEQVRLATGQLATIAKVADLPQAGGQRQRLGAHSPAVQPHQAAIPDYGQDHKARQVQPAKSLLVLPRVQGGLIEAPLDASANAQAGFAYGKAPHARQSFGRLDQPAREAKQPARPAKHLQVAHARPQQAPHSVQIHEAPNGRPTSTEVLANQQRSASPQVPQFEKQTKQVHRSSTPEDRITQEEGHARAEQDDRKRDGNEFAAEQEDQAMSGEPEFDHEYAELITMTYEDLKAEDFDVNPNAQVLHLPEDIPADTLHGKLASMRRFNPRSQADFFATLPISQWEEAGEWFLDQFGDTVARFKNARREKREAAKHFEEEVACRYEAVSKKRKLTDDAFTEMRQSGSQVLLGTPKKGMKQ